MNLEKLRHTRIYNFDQAYHQFNEPFLQLAKALHRGDPLADAAIGSLEEFPMGLQMQIIDEALQGEYSRAPDELVGLIQWAQKEPDWVDWSRIERGAAFLMRTGILGGITLGAKSLIEGYCAPAGNKPLVFSGRLQNYTAMRLNETARFVEAVGSKNGMKIGGPGYTLTLKVRLLHARVRWMIENSDNWRRDLWASPINQHDMVSTIHLFSTSFLEGVEFLGMEVSELDREDFMHLWRYVGYLIGVEDHLLPRAHKEAQQQWEMISLTQGPPDEDSRELTLALLEGPERAAQTEREKKLSEKHSEWAKGISRALLGDELADQLGLPRNSWIYAAPVIQKAVKALNHARKAPFVDPWLEEKGRNYWAATIAMAAQGNALRFSFPKKLVNE